MNSYTATVIKTGNSHALRVPKKYVEDYKLSSGDKILIDAPNKSAPQDREKIRKIIKELQAINALTSIKDPVRWQQDIRKDRSLPGRS